MPTQSTHAPAWRRLAGWAGALGLLCGLLPLAAQSPAPGGAEAALDLRITDGALPAEQRLIRVRQGADLRWRVQSNQAGELHLHAYRITVSLPATQPRELAFKAFASGRFRLEWHPAQAPGPAAPGHHAPALATLEVLPP